MQPGSIVLFIEDKLLYGRMWIIEVTGNGHLLCESLHERLEDGTYRREVFHAMELELDESVREAA